MLAVDRTTSLELTLSQWSSKKGGAPKVATIHEQKCIIVGSSSEKRGEGECLGDELRTNGSFGDNALKKMTHFCFR